MKIIAVICNNRQEWRYFVDTLQWKLSKENKRYKTVAEAIVDIDKQMKYILVPNSYSGIEKIRGVELHNYTSMASNIDNELFNYLRSV